MPVSKKYTFEFEQSPSKKGTCPKCQKQSCFRYYKIIPREYGICDHKNKCEHHNDPSKATAEVKKELYKLFDNSVILSEPVQDKKTLYPTTEQLKVLNNLNSNFHDFCFNALEITKEHLQKWNVGTDNKGNTAFVYQTLSGKHINIKFMNYSITPNGKDCKRDKKVNFSLVANDKTKEQYEMCLFGEHLLTDKIICLVESEKTAIVSSFFYPQYDWLATGGSNGLTVKKVQLLKGKQVYYLGDNDKAGKENSTLKKLELYNIKFQKINFEIAKDGEDLADIIINGERPAIKPTEEKKKFIFYIPIYEYDKDREERVIKDVKINYTVWTELLYSMGYRRFDLGIKGFIFVKIENQILREISITQIQDEFISYLKSLVIEGIQEEYIDELKKCIIEKFYKSIANYFNDKRLALLTHEELFAFNQDSATESIVYYKNGYVKVTANNWELLGYHTLKGCIWKNQIIDRPFHKKELLNSNLENESVFSQFMFKISGDTERFKALCSIVGYNLHIFYETKLKATVFTDSSLSEEAEGRTGKTLLAKSLGHIRKYVEISGKNFDTNDKYRYAKCDLDTQIVHNNDVRKHFDFEILYNDITEGIDVDKKNQQPFHQRVKYILSSNKTIKMDGASSRDRSIEFELAEHYNDKFQPRDEFGHWFFTDWNTEEWNRFDNFMIYCINHYLKNGLIQPNEINLRKRKLIDQTCAEFIEYINAIDIKENTKYNRDEWHKEFLENYPDLKDDKFKKQLKTFTNYLKIFSASSDRFDKLIPSVDLTRSNNINYVSFRLK
jgi:hypothetical protein